MDSAAIEKISERELLDFFRQSPLFNQIRPEKFNDIVKEVEIIVYPRGGVILKENDPSKELYFIYEGEVNLLKDEPTTNQKIVIHTLKKGDVLGEMSLIDSNPRSSTAQSHKEVILLKLPNQFLDNYLKTNPQFYNRFITNISSLCISRLRNVSQSYVNNLCKEIDFLQRQNEAGKFLLLVLLLFLLTNIASFFKEYDTNSSTLIFKWAYLGVCFLLVYGFIWWFNYPLSKFGVTFKGGIKALREAAIITIFLLPIMYLFYDVYTHMDTNSWSVYPFTYSPKDKSMSFPLFLVIQPIYLFHTFIQEFVARGILQTSFQNFLNDKQGYLGILCTSVLFGVSHTQYGIVTASLVFIFSVMMGLIYLRQRNLIGVTFVHFWLGVYAEFLGIV